MTTLEPPFHLEIDVDAGDAPVDVTVLPSKPGVYALEDEAGRTAVLAVTANLRQRLGDRLNRPSTRQAPTRRIVRRVRALTVGSSFEADWAYLAHARARLPGSYRSLLDRWRGWFIEVEPAAEHPRFVKTSDPSGDGGRFCFGPFLDKHVAQRAVEAIESAFDLCRFHHILVQAPDGAACAYKEMGRCPAPCDGTIGMDDYRAMIGQAIAFLRAAYGREAWEASMRDAAGRLDFEEAERLKRRVEETAVLAQPGAKAARPLDEFRFAVVAPSERDDRARILVVHGGHVAPFADVDAEAPLAAFASIAEAMDDLAPPALDEDVVRQHVGLVCRHLYDRRSPARAAFLRLPVEPGRLRRAVRAAMRAGEPAAVEESEMESPG